MKKNDLKIKNICDEGAINIANGIITQAMNDYKVCFLGDAISKLSPKSEMKQIENFMHSRIASVLTKSNPDYIIKQTKLYTLEETIEILNELLEDEDDRILKIKLYKAKTKEKSAISYILPGRFLLDIKNILKMSIDNLSTEYEEILKKCN